MTASASAIEHPLGRRIAAEVDEVVRFARADGPAKLDVERVAARLRIEVRADNLGKDLLGLTIDSRSMVLHKRLRGAARAFVFAHEVAHALRRRALFRSVSNSEEEWFADWFARELVLPRQAARQAWHDAKIAALHITSATLALQLSALGAAPPLMRDRQRVLCRTCGTRQYQLGCECANWRSDPENRHTLPELRQWLREHSPAPESGVDAQLALGDGRVLLFQAKRVHRAPS